MSIDGAKLETLIGLIVKGLAWYHWQITIGPACNVEVLTLTAARERLFARHSGMNASAHVERTLGMDLFAYKGAQGTDNPLVGVWELSIYSGLVMTD